VLPKQCKLRCLTVICSTINSFTTVHMLDTRVCKLPIPAYRFANWCRTARSDSLIAVAQQIHIYTTRFHLCWDRVCDCCLVASRRMLSLCSLPLTYRTETCVLAFFAGMTFWLSPGERLYLLLPRSAPAGPPFGAMVNLPHWVQRHRARYSCDCCTSTLCFCHSRSRFMDCLLHRRGLRCWHYTLIGTIYLANTRQHS
jgi:hypothetical protein